MNAVHKRAATAVPTVGEIMTTRPVSIRADQRVGGAAREMAQGNFRHLPVVDVRDRVEGVVSDRDLVAAHDHDARVRDVMAVDVQTVRPETAAHEAAFLLLQSGIGCVPVVDGAGRLVGIVTERDFVRIAYVVLGGSAPVEALITSEIEAERS